MTPLALFLLGCATVFFGTVQAAFSALMQVVAELGVDMGAALFASRPAREIVRLLQELAPDDAAALIDRFPEPLADEVREQMRGQHPTAQIAEVLGHREGTAGRIMPPEEFAAAHRDLFDRNYALGEKLLESGLIWPALEFCLKCSHLFNILDSSGSIGVTERTAYILKVRQLAVKIARAYVDATVTEPLALKEDS